MERLHRNHSERTILYVEDDDLLRGMMARVINVQYPHFRVIVAENGHEALDKNKEHQPDLIIMDYCMPVMDEYQLSEMILSRNADSRIIILSGYLNSHIKEQFNTIGINIFVEKPFEREDLYRAIDRFCFRD